MSEHANSNEIPPAKAISVTDLAAAMGIDEDELLQRIAAVMLRREDALSEDAP